jgi:hypothetical protein
MLRSVKVLMLAGSVGIGLLAVNAPVRADIIPTLNALPSAVSGGFLWEYDAQLTQQQFLKSGDFFTIFDFNGYVPGSATVPNANWMFTSLNTGLLPAGLVGIVDSPSIPNLTWKYTGPDTSNGPTDLGLFTAKSAYEALGTGMYGAQGHKWSKIGSFVLPDHGKPTMNKGPITTPVVPEPCSMALLGLGAAPLLRLRRRGRKA